MQVAKEIVSFLENAKLVVQIELDWNHGLNEN
jgi:hypothetical protein